MRPFVSNRHTPRFGIQAFLSLGPAERQVQDLLHLHQAHIVFKHSPQCGLSLLAHAEVERYVANRDALPVTLVDVIAQRSLSQLVAETTAVRHESPQVLVVRDGVVQWHASHRGVTVEALTRASCDRDPPGPPTAA